MAIQTLNIGTTPNDGTGDTLRTGGDKINDNFTDATNAASKLVQTSLTDETADRVMTVGAFGLGASGQSRVRPTDCDAVTATGLYVLGGTATNKPPSFGVESFKLFHSDWDSTAYATQQAMSVISNKFAIRTLNNNVWTDWTEVFTEANLNPNVFGGTGGSTVIGLGHAQTSSVLRVSLPISGATNPSSITIVDGFDIQTVTLSTVETNITSITLSSGSSNKIAWLSITGLTGLTAGEPYYLRTNAATSKITVNF
jgi:hypothetical protein